ncbi:aminoglycoside phosphotransferase family protein [Leisingera aquaemixtae]|nr:aminoglycoside phosphotransferase family protein [Leisingera aquaemixtae]
MNSERPPAAASGDAYAAMNLVQARTQALWPRIASETGLPETRAVFRRMQVNRRLEHRRCVLEVGIEDGRKFVLRADFEDTNPLRLNRFVDRQQRAAASLKPVPGVSSPAVLWRDPDRPFVLMEFVPGDTAFRELALTDCGLGARSQVLQRIGNAVAEFHKVSGVGDRQFWPKPFLTKVSNRAQAVREGRLPIPKPNRFLGLCAHLHRTGRRARGHAFRGALEHGDLHLRNILMSDAGICFIDFSNHDGVFPQRDIADIWLSNCPDHLASDGRTPGFGLVAQADWEAFEEGYGEELVNDPIFQFFFAWRLFRLWSSLGRKPPEQHLKTARVAASAVRVLDALLADEAG